MSVLLIKSSTYTGRQTFLSAVNEFFNLLGRVSETSWEIYDENLDRWRKALITIYHMPIKMGEAIDLASADTFHLIRDAQNKAENSLMRIRGIFKRGEEERFYDDLAPEVIRDVRQKIIEKYGKTCVVGYEQIRDIIAEIEEAEFAKISSEQKSELVVLPDNND